MACSLTLHRGITRYNILENATREINKFFRQHPNLYKVALLANHIFRAVAMTAFCFALPFSLPVNIMVCFTTSLFYRLTVETNCAYKFALPAFGGSMTLPLALEGITNLAHGVACSSFKAFVLNTLYFLPVTAYLTYVVLTVSYDVDHRC